MALLLIALATLPCQASVREFEEDVEFHFTGTQIQHWRTTRATLQRATGFSGSRLALRSATSSHHAWSGDRVVIQLRESMPWPAQDIASVGLQADRQVTPNTWILQASDAWAAARAAHQLASHPAILHAAPVLQHPVRLHSRFAPRPYDPFFTLQWHLENRDADGHRLGPDINPRGAWTFTRGAGVNIGICDSGFETTHPDLAAAALGAPHFDFIRNLPVASITDPHGTCVAGLAAARGDNGIGVTGVAPAATLTSLTVFDEGGNLATEERTMDMYQYRPGEIQVLNLSWGNADPTQLGVSTLESIGISNAITSGRGGRGVILVHAGGNGRYINPTHGTLDANANDDATGNDPRFIDVAAVRNDGRAASYSNPGACLLVGALSGDQNDPIARTENLVTTDQVGTAGLNWSDLGTLADYAHGSSGFNGTSASTPLVSGIAALMLAANPALTYRDVQQIFVLASHYYDASDPAVHANGAGFQVGDNQGYGIPNATEAVQLARTWINRPPLVTLRFPTNTLLDIPDDGLRVLATGTNLTSTSLRCLPARGPHPDDPTAELPLTFVGVAAVELTPGLLHGRAALIERSGASTRDQIQRAARAGASFAVIYNSFLRNEFFTPDGTDYVTIPAVVIGESDGRALAARLQGGEQVRAQLHLDKARLSFAVTNTLVCEHVGLRVRTDHPRRGDLRITLRSPSGTRSVLQRLNSDTSPGPDNWTYWSVQHFYEPSAGLWTAEFADETSSAHGFVREAELIVLGVPIVDADADGLDDNWELKWFGSLAFGPADDPDLDGLTNAREQILATDPSASSRPLVMELGPYDTSGRLRFSWPGQEGAEYQLFGSPVAGPSGEATLIGRIPGRFPETDIVLQPSGSHQFFWLQTIGPGPAVR